jgi:hypothetical protein
VLRSVVQIRAGLLGLGDCFSDLNPGDVWSRLWRLSAGKWTGPVRPRLAGNEPVFLDMVKAGQAGSAWAVGYSGDVGIIALYGSVSR